MSARHFFQADYEPLRESCPSLGTIARLPWDEAVFGFPVADVRFGNTPPSPASLSVLETALREFCRETKCELVSVHAEGADTMTQALLFAAGFVPVEFSLLATCSALRPDCLPERRLSLRPAEPGDHEAIFRIAGSAFAFGRYHGDPFFPRELAHRRYVQWMRRALQSGDANEHVLVLGGPGSVVGFMNVVVHGEDADLRLGAVDPANDLGFVGSSLYAETLRCVWSLGAGRASAKVAAANTRVLNVCAVLRFHFSHPEVTFHWHAPDAPHLLRNDIGAERTRHST